MTRPTPPLCEQALLDSAYQLAGLTFRELALRADLTPPTDLVHAKGWLGQTLELLLGATAGSAPLPDFVELGIELKTLPLDFFGKPMETTYLCIAPIPYPHTSFEESLVYQKIQKILWFPYLAAKELAPFQKKLGTPLLWSPSPEIWDTLKKDWEEITERIRLGHFEKLSAHLGTYLQIRPKAANAKTFSYVFNHEGERVAIVPKGFYLRTQLTAQICQNYYAIFS